MTARGADRKLAHIVFYGWRIVSVVFLMHFVSVGLVFYSYSVLFKALAADFGGSLRRFDLPLEPAGTDFQRRVWQQLLRIPYAQTRTYGQLARAIRNPRACRAVGAANGRNPIPIVIPCHRVIGHDGRLTGFASGLWRKQWLLEHERRWGG